jgi:hypothetical protein
MVNRIVARDYAKLRMGGVVVAIGARCANGCPGSPRRQNRTRDVAPNCYAAVENRDMFA